MHQRVVAAHPDAVWTGRQLPARRSAWIRGLMASAASIVVSAPLYYGWTRAMGKTGDRRPPPHAGVGSS